jgi:hypothetical protein
VESIVLLSALGGDCLDDFDPLRRDRGLAALLGYDLPAASTARQWLDRFHDETLLAGRPVQGSFIPPESAALAGLRTVVQHSVRTYVAAVRPAPAVTLDVDAHLVESAKRSALPTYEGYRGYQPLLVCWAETGLVLADEFRDGNVPASRNIRALVDEAFAALPTRADSEPWQVSVRSDSAAYEQTTLDHWQARGWRFAVSADMSPQLRQESVALPFEAWQPWATEAGGVVREWAEVPCVPSRKTEQRDTPPFRYLAVRVRTPQGVLFGHGSTVKPFAVVTNDWDTDGQTLLEWQRGKAGTIEHVHRVLKDELGRLPSFNATQFFAPAPTWGLAVGYPGGAVYIPISQQERLGPTQEDVTPGMRVRAADGDIGVIDRVEFDEMGRLNAFWVQAGGTFSRELRVPTSWIATIDDSGVALMVRRAQIRASLGQEGRAALDD